MSRRLPRFPTRQQAFGFTLVELMIAMVLSLLILVALVTLFVNSSRSNRVMAQTNALIENGRFAIQLMQQDLAHAGFWGGYMPQFDDFSSISVPGDVPNAIPDPCAINLLNDAYRKNLIGIAVESRATLPAGGGCLQTAPAATLQRAGTDVLIVRHADTCALRWDGAAWVLEAGASGNCDAFQATRPYFQASSCTFERSWLADAAAVDGVTLPADLAPPQGTLPDVVPVNTAGAYAGVTVRIENGTGNGPSRLITAYANGTRDATLAPAWTNPTISLFAPPPGPARFSLDYALGNRFPLRQRDCATPAMIRRLISNIYYVSNFAHPDPDRAGEVIPTLVRSELDFTGGALAQQAPVRLIEGIEQFRVELGVDNRMTRCGLDNPVNYGQSVVATATCAPGGGASLPTNRGDGVPDRFVRCTTAAPCTAAQLMDVVAVRLYLLVRAREPTAGYTDTRTYCLGEPANDGSCCARGLDNNGNCPAGPPDANGSLVAAAMDGYKRHVFSTTVRLVNVAGRRDTP